MASWEDCSARGDGRHDPLRFRPPLKKSTSLPSPVVGSARGGAGGGAWPGQRCDGGTSPRTLSTWRPQPANDGFPHWEQVMRWHMLRSLPDSRRFHRVGPRRRADRAFDRRAQLRRAPRLAHDPRAVLPRRSMPHVLGVPARELGDPIAVRVLVKTRDRRRAHRATQTGSPSSERSTGARGNARRSRARPRSSGIGAVIATRAPDTG